MGIGLSAQGVNMNRLPGEYTVQCRTDSLSLADALLIACTCLVLELASNGFTFVGKTSSEKFKTVPYRYVVGKESVLACC